MRNSDASPVKKNKLGTPNGKHSFKEGKQTDDDATMGTIVADMPSDNTSPPDESPSKKPIPPSTTYDSSVLENIWQTKQAKSAELAALQLMDYIVFLILNTASVGALIGTALGLLLLTNPILVVVSTIAMATLGVVVGGLYQLYRSNLPRQKQLKNEIAQLEQELEALEYYTSPEYLANTQINGVVEGTRRRKLVEMLIGKAAFIQAIQNKRNNRSANKPSQEFIPPWDFHMFIWIQTFAMLGALTLGAAGMLAGIILGGTAGYVYHNYDDLKARFSKSSTTETASSEQPGTAKSLQDKLKNALETLENEKQGRSINGQSNWDVLLPGRVFSVLLITLMAFIAFGFPAPGVGAVIICSTSLFAAFIPHIQQGLNQLADKLNIIPTPQERRSIPNTGFLNKFRRQLSVFWYDTLGKVFGNGQDHNDVNPLFVDKDKQTPSPARLDFPVYLITMFTVTGAIPFFAALFAVLGTFAFPGLGTTGGAALGAQVGFVFGLSIGLAWRHLLGAKRLLNYYLTDKNTHFARKKTLPEGLNNPYVLGNGAEANYEAALAALNNKADDPLDKDYAGNKVPFDEGGNHPSPFKYSLLITGGCGFGAAVGTLIMEAIGAAVGGPLGMQLTGGAGIALCSLIGMSLFLAAGYVIPKLTGRNTSSRNLPWWSNGFAMALTATLAIAAIAALSTPIPAALATACTHFMVFHAAHMAVNPMMWGAELMLVMLFGGIVIPAALNYFKERAQQNQTHERMSEQELGDRLQIPLDQADRLTKVNTIIVRHHPVEGKNFASQSAKINQIGSDGPPTLQAAPALSA